MKIANGSHVTIAYTLKLDGEDEVVDQSTKEEPLSFVSGVGRMMPGFEKNIDGMVAGQSISFSVGPDDGYGPRRPELEDAIPRSRFPENVEIFEGLVFTAMTPQGPLRFTVTSFDDEEVKVDLNHPLAGKELHFDVEILGVRDATAEELSGGCGCGDSGCGDSHGEAQRCCGDGHAAGGCGGGAGGCC